MCCDLIIDFIFTVSLNFLIYDSPTLIAIRIKRLLCLRGLPLVEILPSGRKLWLVGSFQDKA